MITYGRLTNLSASISGLFAARICLDHFENVVLVEAESWPGSDDAQRRNAWNQEHTRSRVMQYHSFHGSFVPICICDLLDALQKDIPLSFTRYTASCSPTLIRNARLPRCVMHPKLVAKVLWQYIIAKTVALRISSIA